MSGRLAVNVAVRHPESGEAVVLRAGTEVPVWAAPLITNPDVWEGEAPAGSTGRPPTAGRGSGVEVWAAYAVAHGLVLPEGMGRDEIIAACEASGVPVRE